MKDLKSLNRFFVKYRGRLLAGIVFVALANLLNIFPAQLTRDAIDFVLRNKKSFDALSNDVNHQQLFYNSVIKNIAWLGFLILLSVFARGVFLFLMRQTIIVMSRHIEYDQKNEIYNHYQQLDMSFYARNNTGDLMNRISEDVSRVRMYAGPAIMYTINMAVMVAMVVWAMMRISPTLCLYVLMPLPVMVLLIYFIQNNINKKGELVQQKLSTLSSKVQETFSGIRIVKSFSKEKLSFACVGAIDCYVFSVYHAVDWHQHN
jgi:ATP-binding cassette subfamily B protein